MKRKSRIGISLLALSMLCTQVNSLSVYAKNNIEPVQRYKLSSLEQAKKNLADFEAKYATELARLNQGSKGYFDSIGVGASTDRIFDKNSSNMATANLASYTNMGQKDDATSLENMQASIAYLKECNEIRKKEGLSELKVSTWLTAIAQVNANRAKTKMSHAGVYATNENLAWGYGNANTAGSPFRGWYDEEKAEYLAGNHKFSDVGHYLSIVEPENTVTGFAIGTNGSFGTVHCQEFLDEVLYVNYEVQMTVSEFEKSFNSYYNNLKSIDSQHKALQKAVEAQSGKWIQTNKKWWYKHSDGSYTRNDFEYIDGHWYYFDKNGYMITGWKQVGTNWYYFTGSGIMASNQWMGNYYFEENGAMATNKWIGKYYVGANGLYRPAKWIQQNNRWWYRHQDGGYTKNNFEQIDGKWYYFDSNGYMITGWKQVGSNWYYFTNTGAMASNQWIGNYYFEASGAMATNKWIGNYHVGANGKWDMTR